MTGITWWTRMVNTVRFLDDAVEALEQGRSVILNFPDDVPWSEIMAEELCQRLAGVSDQRTFDLHAADGTDDPEEFLFNRYCSEEERLKYWPPTHISPMRFMAGNPNTPLHHRFVCLTGIRSGMAEKWCSAISGYLETCGETEEHGVFILVMQHTAVQTAKHIDCLQYADYVTDYDCMMLCLTTISSLPCSRREKLYISEMASGIAQNRVEIAGLLVEYEQELIRNPLTVSRKVFAENALPDKHLEEQVNAAVWEAQIRLVFPIMESFRRQLVQKYEMKIARHLPIRSATGERIDKPSDLEIGQLNYICKGNILLERAEYDMLGKMRDARNKLAHRDSLSYYDLTQLHIF